MSAHLTLMSPPCEVDNVPHTEDGESEVGEERPYRQGKGLRFPLRPLGFQVSVSHSEFCSTVGSLSNFPLKEVDTFSFSLGS